MGASRLARLRFLAVGGLVLMFVLVVLVVLAPPVGAVSSGGTSAVDPRIGAGDCRLLGRTFLPGHGCSRDDCLPSAYIVNRARGAELCALPHQGRHAYGAPIDFRRCAALHRAWIAQVNWCASNPDRSRSVVHHAPQCTGSATTYVTHSEREGFYDECLKPSQVRRLTRLARRNGTTLGREALVRSKTLCNYRPRHIFSDGRCVRAHGQTATTGGVVLIGDSIAWRGTDELGRIRPDFHIDGIPSRRLTDLAPRLDRFRLDHGDPDGLIVELGTNSAKDFHKGDLDSILGSLPTETVVLLVLPYRRNPHAPPKIQPQSTRYAAWMRDLASDRANTCVADWRAYVLTHPAVLVDGVHPTPSGEGAWASWTAKSWRTCHGAR